MEGRLYALFYTILHKGLQHPQMWVPAGGPGDNVPQKLREDCIKVPTASFSRLHWNTIGAET